MSQGTPRIITGKEAQELADRFFEKTCPEPNSGCLLWTACISPYGYGRFGVDGKTVHAHRAVWLIIYGRWPDPCALHKCDTRPCVNIDHLFEGTKKDNMVDMHAKGRNYQARITHCQSGHEYVGRNLILYRGKRYCRECGRLSNQAYKERIRELRKV